jgi:hypothetical protein
MKKSDVVKKCIAGSERRSEPDVVYLPWYKIMFDSNKALISDSKEEVLKARKAHNDRVLAQMKQENDAKRNQK